jgi:hypothetical protein
MANSDQTQRIEECRRMKFMNRSGLLLSLTLLSGAAFGAEAGAVDRVKLDRTVVSGNQELPKVLYILPWESNETRPAIEYSLAPYSDDILQRVDPASHTRQLNQLDALRSETTSR